MLPTANVYADRLSEILAAVHFAQTYNSQFIHGYFESDTFSTIYKCRWLLQPDLVYCILKVTVHANTFIQRIKTLLTSVLSLPENNLAMTSTHVALNLQHLHYVLFSNRQEHILLTSELINFDVQMKFS